jgi:hypothetical protein
MAIFARSSLDKNLGWKEGDEIGKEHLMDKALTLAAASRSSFCFCSKDSMDNGSAPGAIVAVFEGQTNGLGVGKS